ncbi:MAG: hypothetical protein MUF15_06280 [Acidobacteria bacterium]|nr:hypothetical protein [Acidobacteriota bacterium]
MEECKINGGDIMPTLAQRLRDEGRMEGRKEGMLEAARRMLREDFTIEQIAKFTGLSEEQLKKAFSKK